MALALTKKIAGEQLDIAKGSARAFVDGARINRSHWDKVRKYLSLKRIRKLPRDIKNKMRTRKRWIWPIDGKCPRAQEGGRRRYRRRRRRYRRRRTRRKRGGRRGARFYRRRRTRRR